MLLFALFYRNLMLLFALFYRNLMLLFALFNRNLMLLFALFYRNLMLLLYPWYRVYRGYIVFAFSIIMSVCLFVCKLFFPSKISQQLLGLGF